MSTSAQACCLLLCHEKLCDSLPFGGCGATWWCLIASLEARRPSRRPSWGQRRRNTASLRSSAALCSSFTWSQSIWRMLKAPECSHFVHRCFHIRREAALNWEKSIIYCCPTPSISQSIASILLSHVTKGVDIQSRLGKALLFSSSKHAAGASEHQRQQAAKAAAGSQPTGYVCRLMMSHWVRPPQFRDTWKVPEFWKPKMRCTWQSSAGQWRRRMVRLIALGSGRLGLDQVWANYGLEAICGPLNFLMWPAQNLKKWWVASRS